MKKPLVHFVIAIALLFSFTQGIAQPPDLGSAAGFVLFSSNGTIINTGVSHLTGNVGTNNGNNTGFGNVNGVMHSNDTATAACSVDLLKTYHQLDTATAAFSHAMVLGNGESLTPGVYYLPGNVTLNQTLTLDARANANAIFIFKIQGTFSSASLATINLINGAQACNIFWKAEGNISLGAGTIMKGTVIANNASVTMGSGVLLEGRALSTSGNVNVNGITAYTSAALGSPLLTGPSIRVLGSIKPYALYSGNGGIINIGATTVKGDVGTNVGVTVGYDSSKVSGSIHPVPDNSTAACSGDLVNLYNYLNNLSPDIELLHPALFGDNLVLTPHTYLLNTAAALTDTLYLDAGGNANAVFVIKVNGALSTSTYATVILINGAQAGNVFWVVDGAVNLNNNTAFKGTIVCNGAINLNAGTELYGRALTTNGALNTAEVSVTMVAPSHIGAEVYTWIGGAGDWNQAANWNTASETPVPAGCEADVIIPSGSPTISSDVSAGNVRIASNINLTVNGSLNVCGTFTGGSGEPATVSGTGVVKLTGNAQQVISGNTTFSNLELNNAAGASIDSASLVSVTGVYTPTSGVLATNGNLVLKSSKNGSAIVNKGNGNYIAGAVTVERYLPPKRAWCLLTAPVAANTTQTIHEAWQEGATSATDNPYPGYGTHITGGSTANGFDQSPSNSSSIKYFDKSWISLGNTSLTTVAKYNGYFLFVRGSRAYDIGGNPSSTGASETTLRVKGELNQGTKTLTFNNPAANQFVLASNPYASPVDFATIGKVNLKNTFWAWDSRRSGTSSGGYVTVSWDDVEEDYDIDYSPFQTAQTRILQSGQAVLMQVQDSNTTSSVTFNETDKTLAGNTSSVFRGTSSDPIEQLRVTLSRYSGSDYVPVDGVLAKFGKGYSSGTDDDAVKLANNDESLSFKRNGIKLSIERRPLITKTDTLFINIDALKNNTGYSMEFDGSNFPGQSYTAILVDKFTGVNTPLNLTANTIVNFSVEGKPASADTSRFMIVFTTSSSLPLDFTGIKAWQTNPGVKIEWNVDNETDVQQYIVEKSADLRQFANVSSVAAKNRNTAETYNCTDIAPFAGDNFYRIKIVQKSGEIKYSSVVKVTLAKGEPSFSIYPNPVQDKKATLQLMNVPKGMYSFKIYDQNGREFFNSKIDHPGNSASQIVLLPTGIAPGTYYFVLRGGENKEISFKQNVLVL